MDKQSQNIIFFDNECNLCHRFINYLFKKDHSKQFFYASLQGSTAQKFLEHEDLKDLRSIIFFKDGTRFKEFKAIVEIVDMIYPKTNKIFKFLPYGFYDIFYRWIAKKRYRFWGKKKLYAPTEVQKKYFLP